MKITDRLIGDHKTFRKMLAELDALALPSIPVRDPNKLIRLVELFKSHLMLHAWFEDHFYYPEIRTHLDRFNGGPVTAVYMNHLDHEHATVDGYLDQLEREVKAVPIAPYWPQTFALFQHGLTSHMKKEEEQLFPESERVFGEVRLGELAMEIERRRSEAPRVGSRTHVEDTASHAPIPPTPDAIQRRP